MNKITKPLTAEEIGTIVKAALSDENGNVDEKELRYKLDSLAYFTVLDAINEQTAFLKSSELYDPFRKGESSVTHFFTSNRKD